MSLLVSIKTDSLYVIYMRESLFYGINIRDVLSLRLSPTTRNHLATYPIFTLARRCQWQDLIKRNPNIDTDIEDHIFNDDDGSVLRIIFIPINLYTILLIKAKKISKGNRTKFKWEGIPPI